MGRIFPTEPSPWPPALSHEPFWELYPTIAAPLRRHAKAAANHAVARALSQ